MTTNPEGAEDETLLLRPFVIADLPAVLQIEQASFPSPWKEEFFLHELHHQYSRVLVAALEGQVVGYLCRWCIADEVQILNVAVHPCYRRRGIGKTLLRDVLTEARLDGVRSVSLEVRSSNTSAIALYEGLGFRQVTVRRRYYENGEDAYLMVCDLSELALPA
jgi:ribosomal-protein-alanine N-acetyltransferase